MESRQIISALSALAQDSRLAIFRLLVQSGPPGLSVGKIAERLEIAPATLSFHLKELSIAGLLTSRQEGRFIIYSANFATMNGLIKFLTDNCCSGNPCTPQTACAMAGNINEGEQA